MVGGRCLLLVATTEGEYGSTGPLRFCFHAGLPWPPAVMWSPLPLWSLPTPRPAATAASAADAACGCVTLRVGVALRGEQNPPASPSPIHCCCCEEPCVTTSWLLLLPAVCRTTPAAALTPCDAWLAPLLWLLLPSDSRRLPAASRSCQLLPGPATDCCAEPLLPMCLLPLGDSTCGTAAAAAESPPCCTSMLMPRPPTAAEVGEPCRLLLPAEAAAGIWCDGCWRLGGGEGLPRLEDPDASTAVTSASRAAAAAWRSHDRERPRVWLVLPWLSTLLVGRCIAMAEDGRCCCWNCCDKILAEPCGCCWCCCCWGPW